LAFSLHNPYPCPWGRGGAVVKTPYSYASEGRYGVSPSREAFRVFKNFFAPDSIEFVLRITWKSEEDSNKPENEGYAAFRLIHKSFPKYTILRRPKPQ